MSRVLSLGFSPCPNDTFLFHDLVHGFAEIEGVVWQPELLDIEALNLAALESPPRFDVTKLSLPALAARIDEYAVLQAGAALGRGCGPLVIADPAGSVASLDDLRGARVAIPGVHTTAFLLLRIFGPEDIQPVPMRFDRILTAVAEGAADAGLIIHESRFTYRDHGLTELADLGVLWETATDLPLPLGIIAARRSLPAPLHQEIEAGLRRSVENAFADPERSRGWVRAHAQEMDDRVCQAHIDLYVNEYSRDLGEAGRDAIRELLHRGRAVGHLPAGGEPWR